MAYIAWSEIFSVGVPELDASHRQLIAIINEFHDAQERGAGVEKLFQVLNALVAYAEQHFADEERRLEEIHYPELLNHRRAHERLLREIFELHGRYERAQADATEDVMSFLKAWLLDHILGFDKKYEPHFEASE